MSSADRALLKSRITGQDIRMLGTPGLLEGDEIIDYIWQLHEDYSYEGHEEGDDSL